MNNKSKNFNNLKQGRGGYAVFIATLVAAIILTIGMGVLNVMLKEFKLSEVQSGSLRAFHGAETGIDCALHSDIQVNSALPTFVSHLTADPASVQNVSPPAVLYHKYNGPTAPLDRNDPNGSGLQPFPTSIECSAPGGAINDTVDVLKVEKIDPGTSGNVVQYITELEPLVGDGVCIYVTVTKECRQCNSGSGAIRERTIIDSRALNVNNCSSPSPRRVERALRLIWE